MTAAGWSLGARHALLPKKGLQKSECEDAIGIQLGARRFCVADGATESFDSRRWARLLTRSWSKQKDLLTVEEMEPWVAGLSTEYEKHWAGKDLPWYAEEKARGGAFAAFVGLAFFDGAAGLEWKSIALGDSCFVHLRGGRMLQGFPMSTHEEFGYHPTLIPSKVERQAGLNALFKTAQGAAEPGDIFLMLSDAVAAWYFKIRAEDPAQAAELERLVDARDLPGVDALVERERLTRMRNDDVAVVRIPVRAGG